MKPLLLLAIGLFILSSALGWQFARSSQSSEQKTAALTSTKSSPKTSTKSTRTVKSTARSQMKSLSALSSEKERVRASLDLAQTIPLADIRAWIEQGLFTQRQGYAATAFRKALLYRWEKDAPDDFLIWKIETGINTSSTALTGLVERRPELFLQIVHSLDSASANKILSSLAQNKPELVWQLLREPSPRSSHYSINDIFRQLAQKNDELMRKEIENLPFSLRKNARSALYTELFKKDFSATINELSELPNGFFFLNSASSIMSENPELLFSHFPQFPTSWKNNLNPRLQIDSKQKLEQWLSYDWEKNGMSKNHREKFTHTILNQTSYRFPDATLAQLNTLELEKSSRENILLNIFQNIDSKERQQQLLAQITNEEDTNYVSTLLGQLESNEEGSYVGASIGLINENDEEAINSKPADAASLVTRLQTIHDEIKQNNTRLSYSSLEHQIMQWSQEQKLTLTAHFEEAQDEEKNLLAAFFLQMGTWGENELANTGLEHFLANEEARVAANVDNGSLIRRTSEHALSLMQNDVKSAGTWTEGLPEGDIRIYTKLNLAQNWKNYDPSAAEEWLSQQPADELSQIRALIDKNK